MKKIILPFAIAILLLAGYACVPQNKDKDDDASEKATREQADKEKDHTLGNRQTH